VQQLLQRQLQQALQQQRHLSYARALQGAQSRTAAAAREPQELLPDPALQALYAGLYETVAPAGGAAAGAGTSPALGHGSMASAEVAAADGVGDAQQADPWLSILHAANPDRALALGSPRTRASGGHGLATAATPAFCWLGDNSDLALI
jgi:hypothetical protein